MTLADFVQKHWKVLASAGAGVVAGAAIDGLRGAIIGPVVGLVSYGLIFADEKELRSNGQIDAESIYLTDVEADTAADRLRTLVNGTSYLAKVQPCAEYAHDPSLLDHSRSHVTVADRGDGYLRVESNLVGNYHDIGANGLKQRVIDVLNAARVTPIPHQPNITQVADAVKRA
jgi:hypothetical protein